MDTIYNKSYAKLDDNEKNALDAARQVLMRGDRLYGTNKEDVSHIEYTLGLALDNLTHLFADQPLSTFVELGIDATGFYVNFLTPTPNSAQ